MGAVYFYHLTQHPVEVTLPMLLAKARGAGWRVVVRGRDAARMNWLDEKLWQGADDGFMPHGLADQPHAADQPVLLTTGVELANGAQCLMCVDGADVTADEVTLLERVCILFDGNDPAALDLARGQWKALTDADAAAQYWSEASGKWQMQAER